MAGILWICFPCYLLNLLAEVQDHQPAPDFSLPRDAWRPGRASLDRWCRHRLIGSGTMQCCAGPWRNCAGSVAVDAGPVRVRDNCSTGSQRQCGACRFPGLAFTFCGDVPIAVDVVGRTRLFGNQRVDSEVLLGGNATGSSPTTARCLIPLRWAVSAATSSLSAVMAYRVAYGWFGIGGHLDCDGLLVVEEPEIPFTRMGTLDPVHFSCSPGTQSRSFFLDTQADEQL